MPRIVDDCVDLTAQDFCGTAARCSVASLSISCSAVESALPSANALAATYSVR
jgi:hypothetical protein